MSALDLDGDFATFSKRSEKVDGLVRACNVLTVHTHNHVPAAQPHLSENVLRWDSAKSETGRLIALHVRRYIHVLQ